MQARVKIELRSTKGETVAEREVRNSVMRAGAEMVARLFSGSGTPITHMGVGISDLPETESFTTAALSNDLEGISPLGGETEAPISPQAFSLEVDETRRVVRVRVRGTLPADAALGTVREAGLISRSDDSTVLYNRVIFAPIEKGDDHELTLFWEVTFPYGDLAWSQ